MPGVPHVVCAQDLADGLCAVVFVRCIIALHVCMYSFCLPKIAVFTRLLHNNSNTLCMVRVSGFERSLRHARIVSVAVPNGQVVVLYDSKQYVVSVWLLSKSVERPYANWRLHRHFVVFTMDVVEIPGEHQGHAIVLTMFSKPKGMYMYSLDGVCTGAFTGSPVPGEHLRVCGNLYMYSLDGVCTGAFTGSPVPGEHLRVCGNLLVECRRDVYKVYALQSAACVTAVCTISGTRCPVLLWSWQQGLTVILSTILPNATTYFQANLGTGSLEVIARSSRTFDLLQVQENDRSLVVFDCRDATIVRMDAAGRRKGQNLCQLLDTYPVNHHWHPSIGCIAQSWYGYHIVWCPDDEEDGRTCQAFRMSCARKAWLSACAL